MFKMNSDKIKGMILGHALGDALGAPVEFYPYSYYTGKLDVPITRYTRAYGKQVSDIGQISDDTEMAIILLKTIINGYTKVKAITNYMIWANNQFENCKGKSPFMGKNTRNLFVAPKPTYKLYKNRFCKFYPDNITKENSQSNGALMRAYAYIFTKEDIIREDVFITNPSELVYNCVSVYTAAIRMALLNVPKKVIQDKVKDMIEFEELSIAYEQACTNSFRNVTYNRGHIIHAFYCAFWGLFQFDNYKDAIDSIICLGPKADEPAKISMKGKWKKTEVLVGDTDTNASIAGALLGAYYGYDNMIQNEVTKTNINTLLNCDSTRGDIIRPPDYRMNQVFIDHILDIFC